MFPLYPLPLPRSIIQKHLPLEMTSSLISSAYNLIINKYFTVKSRQCMMNSENSSYIAGSFASSSVFYRASPLWSGCRGAEADACVRRPDRKLH